MVKNAKCFYLASFFALIMEEIKQLTGLRIFLGSLISDLEKTFNPSTIKAIINRLGQRPGDIVAEELLEKYSKTKEEPFEIPAAAFSLFENSTTQLYKIEVVEQESSEDQIVIKFKNHCFYREVIQGREDLKFSGVLCEFTFGYFETALKKLTGRSVEYRYLKKESTDDYCMIQLIFTKKKEGKQLINKENISEITVENIPESNERNSEKSRESNVRNKEKDNSEDTSKKNIEDNMNINSPKNTVEKNIENDVKKNIDEL